MDRVDTYRKHILEMLEFYKDFGSPAPSQEVEHQIVADTRRDHYQLLTVGWDGLRRIHGCIFHLDIKQGKIWVQHNGTDRDIVGELLERGVPPSDIVLAFHAPYKRPYTGFAVG